MDLIVDKEFTLVDLMSFQSRENAIFELRYEMVKDIVNYIINNNYGDFKFYDDHIISGVIKAKFKINVLSDDEYNLLKSKALKYDEYIKGDVKDE